jgi:subtilisin family serine protease
LLPWLYFTDKLNHKGNFKMKKIFYFLIFCTLISLTFKAFSQPEVTASLLELLAEKDAEDFLPVNIRLTQQYDPEKLQKESFTQQAGTKRREFVINQLRAFSQQEQESLIHELEQMQKQGLIDEIRPYWIANIVHVKAKPQAIAELMSRKDLARLDYDKEHYGLMHRQSELSVDETKKNIIAWNVSMVNAPQAWSQGYTGQDIIVGVMDTGVNYSHQDLQGRMWTHPDFPQHGYNFTGNNFNTMDLNGHGTHVAGTIAGTGASGIATGVAPQAKIMTLKVLTSSGNCTEAGIWAGVQFGVEHGANVLNLSLGLMHAWNPDRATWRTVFTNVAAAGVIAAVATGNEGGFASPPHEVRTPGDVPPPWLHPDQTSVGTTSGVVSVGSLTQNNDLSDFSSKGPVTWQNIAGYNDYKYNPGIGLIRPDISAPGSDIISLTHSSQVGYTTLSGTSMATPAVAGVMALVLSKNPHLTPAQLNQILEESAYFYTSNKSNSFGSGKVDALNALDNTPLKLLNYMSHTLDDSSGNNDGKINPGETISINLNLNNPTEYSLDNPVAIIRTSSEYITITDSIIQLGNFPAESIIEFPAAFSFQVSDTIPGTYRVRFSLEIILNDEQDQQAWKNVLIEEVYAPGLSIASIVIDDSEGGNSNGMLDPGETVLMKVRIENSGLITSEPLELSLTDYLPFIQVEQNLITIPGVEADSAAWVNFVVTAHEVVNPGLISGFNLEVSSGAYRLSRQFNKKIGQILEIFDSGNFEAFNWSHSGNASWHLVSNQVYAGSFSARSGNITHNQRSDLILQQEVMADDSIAFYRRVSSEDRYDWLEFYIDDERVGRWSGNRAWQRVVFPVEAGMRTFTWVYIKDISTSAGNDCAWIDHIEFPVSPSYMAFAGFDAEVCSDQDIELNGYALFFDTLLWQTTGDGTFENPASLNTFYIPGQQDIQQGQVTLSLQAQYQDQEPVVHAMNVDILPAPAIDLGDDRILCRFNTLTFDVTQPGEGNSYLWHNGSTNPVFFIDPDDYTDVDKLHVWVEVTTAIGCNARKEVTLTFDDCVGINDPENNNAMVIYPNPASNRINISFFNPAQQQFEISLINASGQKVKSVYHESGQGQVNIHMNLENLNKGIYFITVSGKDFISNQKFIIN